MSFCGIARPRFERIMSFGNTPPRLQFSVSEAYAICLYLAQYGI